MPAYLKMYYNGIDVTSWVPNDQLQALQTNMSRGDKTLQVTFLNHNGVAAFPQNFVPDRQLWFGKWNPATGDLRHKFGGALKEWGGGPTEKTIRGTTTCTFAVPINELKNIIEYAAFDPTVEDNDIKRVKALGPMLAVSMPEWDFVTGVDGTPSITYPSGAGFEPFTTYEQRSIEYIINDIATDPGQPGDITYPVGTRNWWVEGWLTNPADPSSALKWVIVYKNAITSSFNAYELKDKKAPGDTTVILLEQGARYSASAADMIRKVYIAGPRQEANLVTWTGMTNVLPGHGHITKVLGTNGSWDAGAISKQRILGGDWEAVCQTQEFMLVHEQFEHDDSPVLTLRAHTRQLPVILFETGDTIRNTVGVRGKLGAPRLRTGVAILGWESRAASCILRSHFITNRPGQGIMFHATDGDNFWVVRSTGTDYELVKRVAGTETVVGTLGVAPADDQEVKISTIQLPGGMQIQVYTDNVLQLQTAPQSFNVDATLHGLYGNCDADTTSYEMRWYDFQCTDVWADKAFGLGNVASITDWVQIGYGFVFNMNGTVTLIKGGTVVGTNAFAYNDKWRVSTMLYFDPSSASLKRQVTLDKMAGGEGQWEQLYETHISIPEPSKTSPWYIQFAAKELGATLNNITIRKMFANVFVASSGAYGAASGDYPANGIIQDDNLDTYVKRKQRADSIFMQDAAVRYRLEGQTMPWDEEAAWFPYGIGDRIRVTWPAAKWWDGTGGNPDTRKILVLTDIQRVETPGKLSKPRFKLKLEDRIREVDMAGRRHLKDTKTRTRKPDNKGALTQDPGDPTSFSWPDPTGDETFGDFIEVQVAQLGSDGQANAPQPIGYVPPNANGVKIPVGSLAAGAQHVIRYRGMFRNGVQGDWSETAAFTAPQQPPYEQPYNVIDFIGNGNDVITAGVYEEFQLPESGTIVGWSLASVDSVGAAFPANVAVQVEWAAMQDKLVNGPSAYATITGTGTPTLASTITTAILDNHDMAGWTQVAVKAGDWLRFSVLSTPTVTAKKITMVLWLKRGQ